jgi:LmbE family N-acetylglucosaminyl deacetylase
MESEARPGATSPSDVLARSGDTWAPLTLEARSVVVVQAHTDDFVGGCGGLVRHLAGRGSAIRLITLFRSGRDARELAVREAELEATGTLLNIETSPPLADPVDAEWAIASLIDRFLAHDPELILTPFNVPEVERHPEHVLAGWLVTAASVTTGMTGRRWRYGNVTCFPLFLLARADRAYVMREDELARRADVYRVHASHLGRRPNPQWVDLPGDGEAADYVALSDRRSRYQLQALTSLGNPEGLAGVEVFQSCRPIESRPAAAG